MDVIGRDAIGLVERNQFLTRSEGDGRSGKRGNVGAKLARCSRFWKRFGNVRDSFEKASLRTMA